MTSLLHPKVVIPKVLRILHDSTQESCSGCPTWSICTVKTWFPELTNRKTRWPLFPFPCPGNKLFNFRATTKSRISVITSCGHPTRVFRCKFEPCQCFTLMVIEDFWSNYDVTFAPKSCNSQGFANFAWLHTEKLFRMPTLVDLHRQNAFSRVDY